MSLHHAPLGHAVETIVALSSPPGTSPRAIVRMSGPHSLPTGDRLFESSGGRRLREEKTYHFLKGWLKLRGEAEVPALAYVMKAPRSYTCEDIVEFHIPGSPSLVTMVLEAIQKEGVRMARPGEFTQRAFLNGRIDLTQAEAVCRLIRARSEGEYRRAVESLEGGLRKEVASLKEALIEVLGLVEVSIDFSDQDIEVVSNEALEDQVRRACGQVEHLLKDAADRTVMDQEGILVVILGPPNAGKSSLFNRLVEGGRAIVTPHPGTTRDTLEGSLAEGGFFFQVVDSAGIRDPQDEMERMAQERAREACNRADIQLWVVDASAPLTREVLHVFQGQGWGKSILVLNKQDLGIKAEPQAIREAFGGIPAVKVSALTGEGVPALRAVLKESVLEGEVGGGESQYALNRRHRAHLLRVRGSLERVLYGAARGAGREFMALDLREALEELKAITGEGFYGEMLERIFSSFCIGK